MGLARESQGRGGRLSNKSLASAHETFIRGAARRGKM